MKIGFLPLYISLYDKLGTETKETLRVFYNDVAAKFEERGVEVFKCDICMEDYQFEKEIEKIEANGCDAIVTLHLAYSPGLNSEKALANTTASATPTNILFLVFFIIIYLPFFKILICF